MVKLMFVCLGNICRSPMAEFVMADMVKKAGLSGRISVASAATSDEEEGNGVHYGTLGKLRAEGVPVHPHFATVLTRADKDKYDYFIGMEARNLRNMRRILGEDAEDRIHSLLSFTDEPRDIADPWWTHNFDATYDDVVKGCEALLEHIRNNDLK